MRRKADRQLGVEHCILRAQLRIVDRVFLVGFGVGDHGGHGGFGTGTSGCGHGKEDRRLMEHAQSAAHLADAGARIGHTGSRGFGAVHRGTAAERDDSFAVVVDIHLLCVLNVADRRVRLGTVKDHITDARLVQLFIKAVQQVKTGQALVGHDQHFGDVLGFDEGRQTLHGAGAFQQLRLRPVKNEHGIFHHELEGPVIGFFQLPHGISSSFREPFLLFRFILHFFLFFFKTL